MHAAGGAAENVGATGARVSLHHAAALVGGLATDRVHAMILTGAANPHTRQGAARPAFSDNDSYRVIDVSIVDHRLSSRGRPSLLADAGSTAEGVLAAAVTVKEAGAAGWFAADSEVIGAAVVP